ncbi:MULTISPECIES: DUF2304 domain-containing protein [unclassified Microbacterium]|uniref:DUF2304 domain-containing protein n=1 Tax=unclassified Microbacterium TaxID=2609290 RepID=UPI000CFAF1F1|nr:MULTISPECIES: DUF2304 domain-containing protein [unclassified Microbacterium]PQZ56362.1 hypothetical protein CQ032_09755 [Microbacterium sp. MYb43]PQZ79349.1 hypothetical protein CQ031_09390 [Microbacterium sp. MYb40]PRB19917.1 hypothetical protein CQ040_13580 [Microbacterium sp. MYb54]PRB26907.1 hypothetical protein CQ037_12125 [Microbacterium sp. MYb50]PRB66033.1 hypothetical protein CQ021_12495 [Microbacterium sp. MYb24]
MVVLGALVLSLILLSFILWMLLTRRLREKYAVLWLLIGVAALVASVFPQLLFWLTGVLGVELPANLFFLLAILLLLGVALHLSWELSTSEEEIRVLAEEAGLAETHIAEVQQRLTALESRLDELGKGPQV